MFNLRGRVRFFVFDPLDPKVIYAQATGLWRSNDAGESWKLVYPKPSSIKEIVMRSDHADEDLVAQPDPLRNIAALAVDPANSKVLYAAAGGKKSPALFISRDFGKSWNRQQELPEMPLRMWVDPHSPADSRVLFIAGPHSVSVKTSTGVRTLPVPVTLTDVSAGFGSGSHPVIYGVSEEGIFVSKDGGASWHQSRRRSGSHPRSWAR